MAIAEINSLRARLDAVEGQLRATEVQRYIPMPPFDVSPTSSFMEFSTCTAADFLHPRYMEICDMMKHPFCWQRKLWEWVFVIHHLLESDVVQPGSRGLVFGVGAERLPAVFAQMGAQVVATDAPGEKGEAWEVGGQHANSLSSLRYTDIVDGEVFDANVRFEVCDMENIQPDLNGFDFNWSSCCFEHLGSLEAGMDFVVNAVEKTLRVGGVGVHTTEFNLSSNEDTVTEGPTVIYRRSDIEELVTRLRDRGHTVSEFVVAPPSNYWDFHVDLPPYTSQVHLKLLLGQHVATSAGIVVRRGR